jgi:hypothetical protein
MLGLNSHTYCQATQANRTNQRVLGSSPRGGATYNDKTVILL